MSQLTRENIVFGFLDPKSALRGRKYRERKDGSKYIGNFPSGTGTWAVKLNDWILDPHLKGFTRKELTEYVRIRVKTWREGEDPEERDARDKSAVADAKAAAAATEFTFHFQSEHKGNSARKSKNNTPRKSNEGKLSNGTPRGSFGKPPPSASREPRMDSPLSRSTPNGTPSSIGPPSQLGMSPIERSKYVIKGRDVLIGYWKDSSEIKAINKHAMYGVIQAHGVFRVKVVPETRDGRSTIGNYPASTGGCWVSYDTCVLEKYLKDLTRTEIEEYCRICVVDPDYGGGNQEDGIDRAVREAKKIVAEKAAAKGQNIIEYNRKRVDQLESGAFARQVEKQKKRGELVHTPVKVEVKPTARRSDKATSDARAQKLRLARQEAKEAKERQTANSRGDSDLAEAMRRSGEDQEPPRAQNKHGRNSDVTTTTATGTGAEASWSRHAKDLTNAYGHLSQGSNTPISDKNSVNGGEAEGGKFYQLDRDAQRAKMEKWCSQKPTSRYHRLQGEERRRHIERHIDQKIEAQTGIATAHRPKKRSRTGECPAASPARPGAVSVPSPLARSVSANLQALVTPAALEVAAVHGASRTESPAAQQKVTTQLSPGNIRSNLTLRSLLNSQATPTSGSTVAPQPKPVENTADVQMGDALVEASLPPVTSNSTLSTEPVQNEPSAVTTQPIPMKNAPDIPMVDAPVKVTKTAPPLTSHLTPPAESSPIPASTAEPTAPIAPVQSVQPAKAPPLLQTQQVIITPKSGAPTDRKSVV